MLVILCSKCVFQIYSAISRFILATNFTIHVCLHKVFFLLKLFLLRRLMYIFISCRVYSQKKDLQPFIEDKQKANLRSCSLSLIYIFISCRVFSENFQLSIYYLCIKLPHISRSMMGCVLSTIRGEGIRMVKYNENQIKYKNNNNSFNSNIKAFIPQLWGWLHEFVISISFMKGHILHTFRTCSSFVTISKHVLFGVSLVLGNLSTTLLSIQNFSLFLPVLLHMSRDCKPS